MAVLKIFVSHSHQDNAFCRQLVQALRDANADVWYDEHNLGSGQLLDRIEAELKVRPVFIVILSPAALTSQWVRDESKWAYARYKRDPQRIILPVLAQTIQEDDLWMFIEDFKRVEGPGLTALPPLEAIQRTLHALSLTAKGTSPEPTSPRPTESADDLIARGKALQSQQRYAEAIPLLQRATQLAPRSFDAWFNLGICQNESKHYAEAIDSYDQAILLDPSSAASWHNKGNALWNLKRYSDALAAYERALALDPQSVITWNNKGAALGDLQRHAEALAAYERALALDPQYAVAWNGKGKALSDLQRHVEALAAYERALALDPQYASAWYGKGNALYSLKRYAQALAAYERALALDPQYVLVWNGKGDALSLMYPRS